MEVDKTARNRIGEELVSGYKLFVSNPKNELMSPLIYEDFCDEFGWYSDDDFEDLFHSVIFKEYYYWNRDEKYNTFEEWNENAINIFNNIVTQKIELWLTFPKEITDMKFEEIENFKIRLITPSIKSGIDPLIIYNFCNDFIKVNSRYERIYEDLQQHYQKKEEKPLMYKPEILESELESKWKNLSGVEIDDKRKIIVEAKQNKKTVMNLEDKLKPYLGAKSNVEILETWAKLREANQQKNRFYQYGWIQSLN